MMDVPDAVLADVTAHAGMPGSVADRRYHPGQGPQTEQQLRTLVEGMPHLVWRSSDEGHWTWASPQWMAYTGQSQDESVGRGWLDAIHLDDHERTMQAWEEARPHGQLDMEFRLRRASDGAYLWHRTTSLPVRDDAGRIVEWLGSTTDIQGYKDLQAEQARLLAAAERHARDLEAEVAERRRLEAHLQHTAFHDALTGTRNRAYLMDRLGRLLAQTDGAPPSFALLYFDLDRFSVVNNSLGHHAGDLLLIEVARRFQSCLRKRDLLARLGGDEFAVLVEDVDSLDALTGLAQRLIAALRQPLQIGAQEVFAACSIGLVVAADRHRRPEELLRDADLAMYEAKRHRTGSYAVFNEAMHDKSAGGVALQTDLRHAIAHGGLVLHYQPICDAGTGRMVGLEALARWTHPARGAVPPSLFVPAAEEAGLACDLGRWVLREASVRVRAWRTRYPDLDLRLSVNASGKELMDRRIIAEVRDILAGAGLDPRALQLEMTEGVFLDQPEVVGDVLEGLRALGVRIALDDFGTGYSALGYLDRYPIDALKIDRSFVAGMVAQPRTLAVVEAVVRLGRAMEVDVIAEGVEDEAQLHLLRAAGCGLVQGYLLGRPMPAEGIEAVLARWAA